MLLGARWVGRGERAHVSRTPQGVAFRFALSPESARASLNNDAPRQGPRVVRVPRAHAQNHYFRHTCTRSLSIAVSVAEENVSSCGLMELAAHGNSANGSSFSETGDLGSGRQVWCRRIAWPVRRGLLSLSPTLYFALALSPELNLRKATLIALIIPSILHQSPLPVILSPSVSSSQNPGCHDDHDLTLFFS